jgi:lycopene beta-cyclase/lycopene epsilon-cyclase
MTTGTMPMMTKGLGSLGLGRLTPLTDVLVIGAGPAALAIAADLAERGLAITALAAGDPHTPWVNTYGIWCEEVDSLGLSSLLSHRWSDTVSYFGPGSSAPGSIAPGGSAPGDDGLMQHGRAYGLFDKAALQAHGLDRCAAAAVRWQQGQAASWQQQDQTFVVTTTAGQQHRARLVLDASGHQSVFVHRRQDGPVAGQAAYGIVGRFSAPPIGPGQFVFMDYRSDHLSEEERRQPPTFLYAMDLGNGRFFVEETSLALAPAVPFPLLRQRLLARLAHRGVRVEAIEHEEFCLFPMNPPLPDLNQPVVGFGGAAGMVHPASGFMVGSVLRRSPGLAAVIASALEDPTASAESVAAAAWGALWPAEMRWKHGFYRFGLEKLMRFDEARLRHHFASFFSLAPQQWYGFLTNTLTPAQVLQAMAQLFALAPGDVRWGLMNLQGREPALMARLFTGG